jgi:hypothetical protein
LEARLLSRNAIGIDINPLASLISNVKVTSLDTNQLSLAIRLVKEKLKDCPRRTSVEFPNIDYWFCEKAKDELSRIKFCVENLNGGFNESIHRFMLVCFSSIVRKSSYADPRMAKTYKSKRVLEKTKNGWIPTPIKYFEEALDKNFGRIKSLSEHLNTNNNYVKVFQGDARETSTILMQNGIEEIDFIITSPPYINAQDYFRSYKLEIWWLSLATPEEVRWLNKQAIGTENVSGSNHNSMPQSENQTLDTILRKVWKVNKTKSYILYNYFRDMTSIFKEFYNVLRMKGHFCLVTGNNTICGFKIPTYKILSRIAENNGFKLVETVRDKIRYRSLPPNRNHKGGVIKEEWITVFQKRRTTK